jgi:hypothetical protein
MAASGPTGSLPSGGCEKNPAASQPAIKFPGLKNSCGRSPARRAGHWLQTALLALAFA